jgi:phosphoglycolate phosphatase-like HAD superfamily hydrolase
LRRTPQRNIDTVLFDLDGTLADTNAGAPR